MTKEFMVPGRKGPQRPSQGQPEPSEADELDALLSTPRMMKFRGAMAEFYRIGDLARALKRSPGTIRKWQTAGIIPPPSFGARTKALGGRVRLYSRHQIEMARQIAAEEGILNDPTAAVTQTNFARRLKEVWSP